MTPIKGFLAAVLIGLLALPGVLAAAELDGTYRLADDDIGLILELSSAPDGSVSGSMAIDGETYRLVGAGQGGSASGRMSGPGLDAAFFAQLDGDLLYLDVSQLDQNGVPVEGDSETLTFARAGGSSAAAPTPLTAGGVVVVNGRDLDGETQSALEQLYQVRVQPGRYWYDATCGAWGLEGGPTAGFLLPNMDIGGPLQSNASGGGTGVFVNGREIHPYDLMALQQLLGPVAPGQYLLDAQGNAYTGAGQWLFNLVELARQRGGGGGNTIYRSNITGIGTGSSGGASYVMGKDWAVMVGD